METNECKYQHPDLTLDKNNEIFLLVSIKKQTGMWSQNLKIYSHTVMELLAERKDWKEKVGNLGVGDKIPLPLQDINRIENLYGKCGEFRAVTIYYNKPNKDNICWLNRIKEEYPWYDFISLQDEKDKPFISVLDEKVKLEEIKKRFVKGK